MKNKLFQNKVNLSIAQRIGKTVPEKFICSAKSSVIQLIVQFSNNISMGKLFSEESICLVKNSMLRTRKSQGQRKGKSLLEN
jgi:hypothetical protein